MRYLIFTLVCLAFAFELNSQIGGLQTYSFLDLSMSARATAMGGYMPGARDADINGMYANPALLSSESHHQLSVNHNFHFSDISHGFVGFGQQIDSSGLMAAIGASYVNYGQFDRTDARDNDLGQFAAKEQALVLSISKQWQDRIALGMNLKMINSKLDSYRTHAIGLDLGMHYNNPEKRSSASLVLRNIGLQINNGELLRDGLPFEIQLGYTKRLEHLPFRWSITAHHLNIWDLRDEFDRDDDPIFINDNSQEEGGLSIFADNLFRHLVFGGELLLGSQERVALRMGYNHQRNKQLSTVAFRSFSGFSFGFGLKFKKIRVDYAFANYHLAGGVNHLSMIIDMDSLFNLF